MRYFDVVDGKIVETDAPGKFVVNDASGKLADDGVTPLTTCTCSAGTGNCKSNQTRECPPQEVNSCLEKLRSFCGL